MSSLRELSVPELNQISVDAWSHNAGYWDAAMGHEGNDFFRVLELPALKRLVRPQQGERALDLGTGNGLVARWMASHETLVIATDASNSILSTAKQKHAETKTMNERTEIEFRLLDLTKTDDFEFLVRDSQGTAFSDGFDIVTMNMVIMDIPTLEPLVAALPQLLRKDGRFIATVMHPAFNSPGASRHIEIGQHHRTGRQEVLRSINVKRYLDIPPTNGEAIPGQPAVQLYFSRPISELFTPFFKAGLVLDGLEELAFPEIPNTSPKRRVEAYQDFPQIPLILAFRFRKVA